MNFGNFHILQSISIPSFDFAAVSDLQFLNTEFSLSKFLTYIFAVIFLATKKIITRFSY